MKLCSFEIIFKQTLFFIEKISIENEPILNITIEQRKTSKGHGMHFKMSSQIKQKIFKCQLNGKWFFVHNNLCWNRMFDQINIYK